MTATPEGIHHYDTAGEVPFEVSKYWHQRHEIFSKYDEGVWMTDDAWFGVTPEPVATKIADYMTRTPSHKTTLVDCFAGAGGNAIAFALSGRWKQIFAIELDAKVLECAKHNAEIYGVKNKIVWIQGDCFDVLKKRMKAVQKNAVIFASPPWGGPTYRDYEIFDMETMQPYPLRDLYKPFSNYTQTFVLYLPRTADLEQVAKYAGKDQQLLITHYCMHGASKAICVFFGGYEFSEET